MAGGASLGEGGDDETVISEINVTPLVDIILVVLIIFMVAAPVMMGRAIEVKSPETVSGEEDRVDAGADAHGGRRALPER